MHGSQVLHTAKSFVPLENLFLGAKQCFMLGFRSLANALAATKKFNPLAKIGQFTGTSCLIWVCTLLQTYLMILCSSAGLAFSIMLSGITMIENGCVAERSGGQEPIRMFLLDLFLCGGASE